MDKRLTISDPTADRAVRSAGQELDGQQYHHSLKRCIMIFRQMFDSVSSTYTYVMASRVGGEALIIDPVFEKTDQYLTLLEQLNAQHALFPLENRPII